MPRRSNRLFYCDWDDRDESGLKWSRRLSRESEHLYELPALRNEALMYHRRTIYRAIACGSAAS